MSHLADESNRSCLLDLMSTVQVSSTSADTGVHKVLPSRGKPGLPRATGPRMLCRSAEACDSYECVRIVAIFIWRASCCSCLQFDANNESFCIVLVTTKYFICSLK